MQHAIFNQRVAGFIASALMLAMCGYLLFAKTLPFAVYDRALTPQEIQQSGANSYYAPIALDRAYPLMIVADGPTTGPTASNLQLFENNVRLGPAHSPHAEISGLGGGRYSHWGSSTASNLIFSASDNTDPRTNGRIYTLRVAPEIPAALLVYFTLPLAVFLIQRMLSEKSLLLSIAVATVVVCVSWLFVNGRFILLASDSFAYIEWSELVPLGYPLFLAAVHSLAWTPTVQVVLLAAACLFLSFAIARIGKAAGLAASIVLLASTPAFYNQTGIVSEALFIPAILANVGAAIYLLVEHRRRWALIVAGTAALMMFVRPAGYFVVAGIAFLALYPPLMKNWWSARWLAVPFLLLLVISGAINYAVRGTNAQSQVGRILFPQIAYIFNPEYADPQDRLLALDIDAAIKPYRDQHRRAANLDERLRYFLNNFNWLLSYADIAAYKRFAEVDIAATGQTDRATYFGRLDPLYVRLFLRTVAADPMGFLGIVRDQIVGGWRDNVVHYRGGIRSIFAADARTNSAMAERVSIERLDLGEGSLIPDMSRLDRWPGQIVHFLDDLYRRIQIERWLVYVVGLASLLAIPLSYFYRRRHVLALAYCGVILHGSLLMTATVTVLIPRYAMPTDPVLAVAGVILLDGVARLVSGMITRLTVFYRKPR